MPTADQLLGEMFSWIEQREQSADNLNTLTEELESSGERCMICGQVHGATGTAGAAGSFGAGMVSLLTRVGAASLFGSAGGASSGLGLGLRFFKSRPEVPQITQTLREQLDKIKETFKDFEELRSCIGNSNRSLEDIENFVKIATKHCPNKTVKDWLSDIYNKDPFFKLVDMFYFLKQELEKEKNKKKINPGNIDIIFVAHGSIGEPLIKASDLLLLPTVKDVVLYSPWNCVINSHVAYGIATGFIKPEERCFTCSPTEGSSCSRPHSEHQPTDLPNYWNSMKNAGEQEIPTIYVEPLREPKDRAWKRYILMEGKFGEPGKNRVVIPFKFPQEPGRSMQIPHATMSFALSLVLCDSPFKGTLHLAACLGRSSPITLSQEGENLNQQYSCTIDHTGMTWRDDIFNEVVDEDSELYQTMKYVFDP